MSHYWDVESGRKELDQRGKGNGPALGVSVPREGGLSDLLEAAANGRVFDAVIVESIDRISRMTADATHIERQLEQRDIGLFAADEPMTANATAILTRRVKQGVAEWYVRDLIEKSRRGMEESARHGPAPGGPVPNGYRLEEHPHPNPHKAREGKAFVQSRSAEAMNSCFDGRSASPDAGSLSSPQPARASEPGQTGRRDPRKALHERRPRTSTATVDTTRASAQSRNPIQTTSPRVQRKALPSPKSSPITALAMKRPSVSAARAASVVRLIIRSPFRVVHRSEPKLRRADRWRIGLGADLSPITRGRRRARKISPQGVDSRGVGGLT